MTRAGSGHARIRTFAPHAAVVFGSGLAALPEGAVVEAEIGYRELGWPCTAVPGHANLLRLVSVPLAPVDAGGVDAREPADKPAAVTGAGLRLALACGRPHRYEGWIEAELRRPVTDLVAAGVRRLVLTNSCGALSAAVRPGDVVSCTEVVDLQTAPGRGEPERLAVCGAAEARALAAAVAAAPGAEARARAAPAICASRVHSGAYVAVPGPQFETPAEAAWLAGYGDVVGMSAAPEVRAARAAGASCCLLGLVANRAAAADSHEAVLAAGAALAGALAGALAAAVAARWPEVLSSPN